MFSPRFVCSVGSFRVFQSHYISITLHTVLNGISQLSRGHNIRCIKRVDDTQLVEEGKFDGSAVEKRIKFAGSSFSVHSRQLLPPHFLNQLETPK